MTTVYQSNNIATLARIILEQFDRTEVASHYKSGTTPDNIFGMALSMVDVVNFFNVTITINAGIISVDGNSDASSVEDIIRSEFGDAFFDAFMVTRESAASNMTNFYAAMRKLMSLSEVSTSMYAKDLAYSIIAQSEAKYYHDARAVEARQCIASINEQIANLQEKLWAQEKQLKHEVERSVAADAYGGAYRTMYYRFPGQK